jgi:glyoxylase I family protein
MSKSKDDKFVLKGMAPLIQVYDMQEAVDFYCKKLDFTLKDASEPFDWVWLTFGDCDLMLNTMYDEGERPAKRDECRHLGHQDTCLFFGCPDVQSTYEILIARGLKIDPPDITKYNFKAISVTDPDGYGLCFHWPMDNV